jgi:superfamily I DNA/RNA helicase
MPLSDEQRAALWTAEGEPERGHQIVAARAGTGKTTLLGEYCSDLAHRWPQWYAPWQGAALISFTNVAKDEIEARVASDPNSLVFTRAPHFVGTVNSFLNQHLFLPFGAAIMGCRHRPKLVGAPVGIWVPPRDLGPKPSNTYAARWFDRYSANTDGTWEVVDDRPIRDEYGRHEVPENPRWIERLKQWVWSKGYATQNDANYIALEALKRSPRLTAALVQRFPAIIIDEAQDMTAIQHVIIDHLAEAGHRHMVMVGDAYQAIYEWNTARPQLFIDKTERAPWQSATIASTYRCSPAICTLLTNMTDDRREIRAASGAKNQRYNAPVQVHQYVTGKGPAAVTAAVDSIAGYLADLPSHDRRPSGPTIAVLAWTGAEVASLHRAVTHPANQATEPAKRTKRIKAQLPTKQFLKTLHHLGHANRAAAVEAYETLMLEIYTSATKPDLRSMLAARWGTDDRDIVGYRNRIAADLDRMVEVVSGVSEPLIEHCLPATELTLDGIPAQLLKQIRLELEPAPAALLSQQIPRHEASTAAKFQSHTDFPKISLNFSTIHGVKGETYDGVVLYTDDLKHDCKCSGSSAKKWREILTHPLERCESKRVAYVAVSRAAQVLALIAPKRDADSWTTLTVPSTSAVPTLFD